MNKMANNKNRMILMDNSNGKEFPLLIEDLIPVHSSSTKKRDLKENPSTEDFNRAVALIWNILMNSSENSTVQSPNDSTNNWDSKQVSDA